MSGSASRGASVTVSSKLEENYNRQMGAFDNRRGIQVGIHTETSMDRCKTNLCFKRKFRYFHGGNKYFIRKRCNRENSLSPSKNRFLQYIIPYSQEIRQNKNSDKFETPQQAIKENSLQNGHNAKSDKSSATKRLGHFSGSVRCISSCSNLPKSQTVHEVLCKQSMLPMESHVLRGNFCPKNFHKIGNSCSSLSTNTEYTSCSVSRRLVNCESKQKSADSGSTEMPRSDSCIRFHHKCRKICTDSKSNCDILGGVVPLGQRSSTSNTRESRQSKFYDSDSDTKASEGYRLSEGFRGNGVLYRSHSECTSSHETHSTPSVKFLETNISKSGTTSSIYTTSEIPSAVVVKFSQHAERPVFTVSNQHCYDHNRCFQVGFWGLHWVTDFSGGLEFGPATMAHQLFRNEGSNFDPETLSKPIKGQMCIDQKRQHQRSSIHQSSRGDEVSKPLFSDLGIMADSDSGRDRIEICPYSRQEKCVSRSVESGKNSPNRMVFEQDSCQSDFSFMGKSNGGSVCLLREQTDGDILFLDSTPECLSNGCTNDILGKHVRICLSPNLSYSESVVLYEAVPLQNNSDSPIMATETLVSTNIGTTSGSSSSVTNLGESTESTQNENLPPKSPNVKFDSVAPLNRNFEAEGFSESTRKLLTASWRKGTQKDYVKKFEKYNSWCGEREINPYSATLDQIADFLTFLFESGLQYRTISGYRSMLSAVLPPYQNSPVGKHPFITRLIKGVFQSRPPKVRLLPEWDLDIVLEALQKAPFEPLSNSDMKSVTYKAVFLVAVTTYRRCSDIQSLRIDHESMKVQEKGITFIRHGLSKQDRQNHFGMKIFVPSFPEKQLLDPKRALCIYMERTQNLRQNLSSSDKGKLFLSLNAPHKPVSAPTISSWIVKVVQMAYTDKNFKVRAHSTRAIAPSWALYNGASTKAIIEAADWATESTFVKHYLRDLDSHKYLQ